MDYSFPSKLPDHSQSIFSVMGGLAKEHGAVNLSQGYPNFETDPYLKELVTQAMQEGYNQYAPLAGIPALRAAIAEKSRLLYGSQYDPDTEVTVTNGATQALFLAITAFVNPGDEVIVLKPAYDSYEPAVRLNGGIPVPVQLEGKEYGVNWERVKTHISPRTRMIILNTPHNPSGQLLSVEDMRELENTVQGTGILVLSDEVYEHIVFDGKEHQSVSKFSGLADRSIVCASFGKTFHNTGWKMGYCLAPRELMREIWKVMEVNVFCVHHPSQRAFATYLKQPEHYLQLSDFYQKKRDRFLNLIQSSRFSAKPSSGTYFQLLDFSEISDESDVDFAKRLILQHKIASIPVSVFNEGNRDYKQLRFCFAKTDETLEKAAEILVQL